MRPLLTLPLAVLLVASFAGCGASSQPGGAATSTSTPMATPSATTTASVATEKQVASVIAGQEKNWRRVIDGAGACRIRNVTVKDGDVLAETQVMTCYTDELTAGTTAKIAVRDLGALTIPASMRSLVDETVRILKDLAATDLEGACGPAMSKPSNTDKCNSELGTRMIQYQALGIVLDKWRPYS